MTAVCQNNILKYKHKKRTNVRKITNYNDRIGKSKGYMTQKNYFCTKCFIFVQNTTYIVDFGFVSHI